MITEAPDVAHAHGPRSSAHTLFAAPAYRTFWSARSLSFLGDTMANVAFVLIAAQQRQGTDAAWAVGVLLLAQTIPQTLGPFVGVIADRLDRRRLMIGLNLAQAVVVALLALLAPPFPVTLALVAALFLLATVFLPASQGALPALVPVELLGEANAWLRLGYNVGLAVGPSLAGVLLFFAGPPTVLLLDMLSFLLSALLLVRLPRSLSPAAQPAPTMTAPTGTATAGAPFADVWASLREGFSYLLRQPVARTVTLGLFLVTLFVALDNVGLIFLARQTLQAGAVGYSVLLSAYGAGMIVGPLLVLWLLRRLGAGRVYWIGIAGMGLATLACGLAPTLLVAALCEFGVGIGNGAENIGYDTLLQRATPPALLGRILGAAYSAPYVALLITYSVGGLLLQVTSPRTVFVLAGVGTCATALLLWALLRRTLPARSASLQVATPTTTPDETAQV
ncbi:MAG: MFS transporter [Ktedonobacterales bacterium]